MNQEKSENTSMTGTVAKYWSSKFFRQCLGLIVNFLRPKLLSPEYYGIWTILKLIRKYASYGHLGTRSAVRYLIPFYSGRNDEKSIARLQGSGFIFGLVVNVFIAICVGIVALLPGFSWPVRAGLLSMAVLVLLRYFHHFLVTLLKADEAFDVLTRSIYILVTLTFLTTLPLLYFFEIYGIYASVIIAEIGTIFYLRVAYAFRKGGAFDWQSVMELLRKGFPIAVLNLAIALVTSCDRIVVGAMLGKKALGYYGIAVLGVAFLTEIPGTARAVMEPRLMHIVEKKSPETLVDDYLISPLMKTAYLLPLVVGPAFLAMEAGVTFLLPRYLDGVPAARTLALGVPFLAMAYVPRMLIIARDWQLGACWRVCPILLVNVLLGVVLVKAGYGLFGVALATILSFGLLFLVLFSFLRGRLGDSFTDVKMWLKRLILPLLLMYGLLAGLMQGIPLLTSNIYLQAIISVCIFGVLYICFYKFMVSRMDFLPPLNLRSFL